LTKPKVDNPLRNQVYGWIVGKNEGAFDPRITAVKQLHSGTASVKEAVKAITDHKLTHEMLPTELLTKPEIWDAMLQSGMPFHAMLRNLGNMSKCDLLKPMSKAAKLVVERIEQADMRKLRVHPIQILMANRIYGGGRGARGRGEWVPVPQVVDALDDAFYRAFDAVEPTGQKWLIGLDVSGSMSMDFSNYPGLMVSEAAAAMAMVIARTEPQYYIHGFAQSFVPLNISAKSTLTQALNETSNHTFGSTDCALPMVHAKKRKLDVDVFCVITDNETWAGTVHPFQALRQYRQYIKHDAKLIVVGMTATQFSIADPSDPGMLDVVGFDAAVPTIMADFAKGQL
jgi:60 kDa SS-A/Ro ribonucleoprotein